MTETNNTVLVGYDGSEDADKALDWAAAFALQEDRPIEVVIVEELAIDPTVAAYLPEHFWESLKENATKQLQDAGVQRFTVEHVVESGIVPVMLDRAKHADVVVIGSRGHGWLGDLLGGSVSQHLARHAPCSVVVARDWANPESRRIVVGVDYAEHTGNALRFAVRRASETGESVVALRGLEMVLPYADPMGLAPALPDSWVEDERKLLADTVAKIQAEFPGVTITTDLVMISPSAALVDASKDASLVVVGATGKGAFPGLLLGSVSHEVVHRAHCPVAVVR